MFCNECGKPISDTSKFCSECGAKLPEDRMATSGSANLVQAKSTTNVTQHSKVETITVSCPRCGGQIQPVDGMDTFFCVYCGNKVVLSGLSDAAYKAKTKLKKYEQEERMQHNLLSHEKEILQMKNETARKNRNRKLIITIAIVFLCSIGIGIAVWNYPGTKNKRIIKQIEKLDEQVEEYLDDGEFDKAEKTNKEIKKKIQDLKGNAWGEWIGEYLDNNYDIIRAKRKESGEKAKKITLKSDLEDIDDMKRDEAVEYFLKLGFVNIQYAAVDLPTLGAYKSNDVKQITIDGDDDCEKGEVFRDDVEIIVYAYKSDALY